MKKDALVVVLFALFALVTPAHAWESKPTDQMSDEEIKELRIDAEIDASTLKDVRGAIAEATKKDSKIKLLKVMLTSPGGEAVSGLTSARVLRQLSDQGKVKVEVHASGWCASACTWILASGTPGMRYIDRRTFFLVHPIQKGSMFGGMTCIEHEDKAKTQEAKAGNLFLEIGRDLYMQFTGADQKTVEEWLSCGHEKAGQGQLAVDMKIADKVED